MTMLIMKALQIAKERERGRVIEIDRFGGRERDRNTNNYQILSALYVFLLSVFKLHLAQMH